MSSIQLLTCGEAATRLRMLRCRVNRLAKSGEIPHILLPDGEIRFDAADLADWISRHKRPAEFSTDQCGPIELRDGATLDE